MNFLLQKISLKNISIAIIISKWDTIKEKYNKDDLKDFCESNIPITYNWIKSDVFDEAKIFPFSVGKVEEGKIKSNNNVHTKQIITWFYNKFGLNIATDKNLQNQKKQNWFFKLISN